MKGVFQASVSSLQLDEEQRNAVNKSHKIGTALVELACDPELRNQEVIVVFGSASVYDLHILSLLHAVYLIAEKSAMASCSIMLSSE